MNDHVRESPKYSAALLVVTSGPRTKTETRITASSPGMIRSRRRVQ